MLFQIKSANENKTLFFNLLNEDYLQVSIEQKNFTLSHTVFLHTDTNALKKFFNDISNSSRLNNETKSWSSIEEDLILTASFKTTGSVNLKIKIVHNLGEADWWEHQTSFQVERTALEKISK